MSFHLPTFLKLSTPICSASNSSSGSPLPSPSMISNKKPNKLTLSFYPGESNVLKFEKKNKKSSFKTDVANSISACVIDEKDHILIKIEECADDTILFKFGTRLSMKQKNNLNTKMEEEEEEGEGEEVNDEVEFAQTSGNSIHKHSRTKVAGSCSETEADSNDPPFITKMNVTENEGTEYSDESELNFTEDENIDVTFATSGDSFIDGSGRSENNFKPPASKPPLHFESGVVMLPHPAKASRGGEDAYFIEKDWVGVADGVSVWAELGVNSGLYSREIMWNCSEVVRMEEVGFHPDLVIEEGHSRTDLMGSCTIAVACIHCRNVRIANIGDSGFMIVRDGEVIAQSSPMMHAFSKPYQIGTEGAGRDDPSSAEIYEVEVEPGDVLVVATDGLFDNVFKEIIAEIINQTLKEGKNAETCARKLANLAQRQGALTSGKTPHSEEAKSHGQNCEGGRRDDVTVIVSYIC